MVDVKDGKFSLSVGNRTLDTQHQQAFEMLQAVSVLLNDSASTNSDFHQALNDFFAFLELHFTTEEAILAKNACPSLAAHKTEHDAMLEALSELLFAAMAGRVDKTRLLAFMSDLVLRHVPEVDIPSKSYMR